MNADQQPEDLLRFKTVVVYGTAAFLVIGGMLGLFALIVFAYLDAVAGVAIIASLIGSGATLLFGTVQQKQAEQSIERANLVARSTVNGTVQAPNRATPDANLPQEDPSP